MNDDDSYETPKIEHDITTSGQEMMKNVFVHFLGDPSIHRCLLKNIHIIYFRAQSIYIIKPVHALFALFVCLWTDTNIDIKQEIDIFRREYGGICIIDNIP